MRQALDFRWSLPDLTTEVLVHEGADPLGWSGTYLEERRPPFIVVDSGVVSPWERSLSRITSSAAGTFTVHAQEEMKSPETLCRLWTAMRAAGVQRDTEVMVVGGGLTCDVGAMAASTWQRGLRLTLVPTTLLAMVDASLGGKTGVNHSGAKNQVGTFHPADRVIVAPAFLETLPPMEMKGAWAEVLKTALIGDAGIAELIPSDGIVQRGVIMEAVLRCLAVKGRIVASDLRESGPRMILNLGHTVGHVLESISGYSLSHGEAVGLGLLVEAGIAARLGGNPGLQDRIREILERAGLPVRLEKEPEGAHLAGLLYSDKKSGLHSRTWALPFDWEDCRLVPLDLSEEERLLPVSLEESMGHAT